MLFIALAALSAACNPTRRYLLRSTPPGAWRDVSTVALPPIDWRESRIDGMAFTEFASMLAPDRQVSLRNDIANASELLTQSLVERTWALRVRPGRGHPQLRVAVLRWERGYWNFLGNRPTILRLRVVLERRPGRLDDVVDLETTFNHPVTQPNPAAGIQAAADQLASELAAWLRERTGR